MAQRRPHSPHLVPGWLWGGSETSGWVATTLSLSVSETPDPRAAQLTAATTSLSALTWRPTSRTLHGYLI